MRLLLNFDSWTLLNHLDGKKYKFYDILGIYRGFLIGPLSLVKKLMAHEDNFFDVFLFIT